MNHADQVKVERLTEALIWMCEQYLGTEYGFEHQFMSAGERACGVLCDLYPERFERRPYGMVALST